MSANGVNGTLPSVEEQLRIRRERLAGTIKWGRSGKYKGASTRIANGQCAKCGKSLLGTHKYYVVLCQQCQSKHASYMKARKNADPYLRVRIALKTIKHQAEIQGYVPCITSIDIIVSAYVSSSNCDRRKCVFNDREELTRGYNPRNLDHCHTSGQFRGWICKSCNYKLGIFENQLEIDMNVSYIGKIQSRMSSWSANPYKREMEMQGELFS